MSFLRDHLLCTCFLVCSMMTSCTCTNTKTHHHHHQSLDEPPSSSTEVSDHRFFLHELFRKYGHNGVMTFEGFEHLLENLGLGGITIKDHDVASHKSDGTRFRSSHKNHQHRREKISWKRETTIPDDTRPGVSTTDSHHDHDHSDHSHHHEEIHLHHHHHQDHDTDSQPPERQLDDHGHNHSENTPPELLDNLTSLVEQHEELGSRKVVVMARKQQCLSATEILHTFDINPTQKPITPVGFLHLCPAIVYELDQQHCRASGMPNSDSVEETVVTAHVWLYASTAVLLISLCGLLSVVVIPIMQKVFYQTLLQFFVGLAVGSLSGDALLHLLPHAMMIGNSGHSHDTLEEGGSGHHDESEEGLVWRGMAALAGVYLFFLAERILNVVSNYRRRRRGQKIVQSSSSVPDSNVEKKEKEAEYKRNSYIPHPDQDDKEALQKLNTSTPEKDLPDSSPTCGEPVYSGVKSKSGEMVLYKQVDDGYVVTIGDEHGHSHHGHGHSHEVPNSVSAVAWMVIMGDGLHNFCDGLAIGAAFAAGIAGGLSTTVAVFCHELPHELGDFAMLLRAGMTVKQALLYNGLSSILCFIGMMIGVALGNLGSATMWVFAGTAGMFLYIALVDMLPELGSNQGRPGTSSSFQLSVQLVGISLGISIMLLIAIYEHDLKHIIS